MAILIYFGKLPTYPSPNKPTLTLSSHLGQNVGLREGQLHSFPETYNDPYFMLLITRASKFAMELEKLLANDTITSQTNLSPKHYIKRVMQKLLGKSLLIGRTKQ